MSDQIPAPRCSEDELDVLEANPKLRRLVAEYVRWFPASADAWEAAKAGPGRATTASLQLIERARRPQPAGTVSG